MWLRSAENGKQTPWLNSLWLSQMFSSLTFCENTSITKSQWVEVGVGGVGYLAAQQASLLLWLCYFRQDHVQTQTSGLWWKSVANVQVHKEEEQLSFIFLDEIFPHLLSVVTSEVGNFSIVGSDLNDLHSGITRKYFDTLRMLCLFSLKSCTYWYYLQRTAFSKVKLYL